MRSPVYTESADQAIWWAAALIVLMFLIRASLFWFNFIKKLHEQAFKKALGHLAGFCFLMLFVCTPLVILFKAIYVFAILAGLMLASGAIIYYMLGKQGKDRLS